MISVEEEDEGEGRTLRDLLLASADKDEEEATIITEDDERTYDEDEGITPELDDGSGGFDEV